MIVPVLSTARRALVLTATLAAALLATPAALADGPPSEEAGAVVSSEPVVEVRKLTKAELRALGIRPLEATPSSIGCLGLPGGSARLRPRCSTTTTEVCYGLYYTHYGQWWFGSLLGGLRIHGQAGWCGYGTRLTRHWSGGAWPEPWGQCRVGWGPENGATGAAYDSVDYTLRANMHCSVGSVPLIGSIQRNEDIWVTVRLWAWGATALLGYS
jgi:hypothetical protein